MSEKEDITPSIEVKTAINLLKKKDRKAAFLAIGKHNAIDCPIAAVYHIDANMPYHELEYGQKKVLRENGWTRKIYTAFINWYDKNGKPRYDLLRKAWKKPKTKGVN